ncbi:MAG: adenylate/guanylate cyclase domain-containing protein [Treponema sp.]|nr:adenylate/guanylate cyclase domain-containing protein [Treponema sp.]
MEKELDYGRFIYAHKDKPKEEEKIPEKEEKLSEEEKKIEPEKRQKKFRIRVKRPISVKMLGIFIPLIIISMGFITAFVSITSKRDTTTNTYYNVYTINKRTASDCTNKFLALETTVNSFYDQIQIIEDETLLKDRESVFFERNNDIAAIYFTTSGRRFFNNEFFVTNEISSFNIENYAAHYEELIQKAQNGILQFENASPSFNNPMLSVFMPVESSENEIAIVLLSSRTLFDTLAEDKINSTYLINSNGNVLVHNNIEYMLSSKNVSSLPVFKLLADNKKDKTSYTSYLSPENKEFICSYTTLSIGSCSVITEVDSDFVMQGIHKTTMTNIYFTGAVIALTILFIWIFSQSLARPLHNLTEVTQLIKNGDFSPSLLEEMDRRRKDEIGVLIESTRDETQMLNTFTKLTNRGVTNAIVKNQIDFEPHLKDVTIFFSDIRGFTAVSDSFNKKYGETSAAQIIGFLNDYMSRMVNCITLAGGTVDKFEGDAIMAAWGVLRDDSLDFELLPEDDENKKAAVENHQKNVLEDALGSIKAAVAMRYSLMEYNLLADRIQEENGTLRPHIKIGCGINSGRVTVGFMGSQDKMEFTSIGDAVNLASRTESSNKLCGTDMLITESTYNLLKEKYIRCESNDYKIDDEYKADEIIVEQIPVTFEVKGKGKQHFYAVVNMPSFDVEAFFRKGNPSFTADPQCLKAAGPEGPGNLKELRQLLGIEEPDFTGVNLDKEEDKVSVN